MACCPEKKYENGKIGEYRLSGPQVEPRSSFWLECPRPCPVPLDALLKVTEDSSSPHFFPPWDPNKVGQEFAQLKCLEVGRDDPQDVYTNYDGRFYAGPNDDVAKSDSGLARCPPSIFLQLRPQPIGAVFAFARGDINFPAVTTGRELARYFEDETPGIAHRHALNYLLRQTGWSPPRQALVWAALDVTIYSALSAAWYYKWLSPRKFTSRRERPAEWAIANKEKFTVIFDKAPACSGCGDGAPRPDLPEVKDFINESPGTPRHPAYPSGHSTYSAAASEILSFFFPDYRREFDYLANNAGVARLWAGVHWPSDHVAGAKLGRTVACLVIEQLRGTGIPLLPGPSNCKETPPALPDLEKERKKFEEQCGKGSNSRVPGLRCDVSKPCVPFE